MSLDWMHWRKPRTCCSHFHVIRSPVKGEFHRNVLVILLESTFLFKKSLFFCSGWVQIFTLTEITGLVVAAHCTAKSMWTPLLKGQFTLKSKNTHFLLTCRAFLSICVVLLWVGDIKRSPPSLWYIGTRWHSVSWRNYLKVVTPLTPLSAVM